MLDTANQQGVLARFRVTETLIFAGDRAPIVLDPETVKRCLLYTSPSPRDATLSRMPSSA